MKLNLEVLINNHYYYFSKEHDCIGICSLGELIIDKRNGIFDPGWDILKKTTPHKLIYALSKEEHDFIPNN